MTLPYGTTPAPLPMSMRKWSKPVRSAKAAPRRLGNRVAVLFSAEKCIKFGLYNKLVYICIVVKADCAAALGRKNKQNT